MPIYTMGDVRLLHIHVPKTGGTSITQKFYDEGWTVTYHTRFEDTRASNYSEPAQHFHYEILTQCKVFELPFESVFMTCRHPFNRFISEYLFQDRGIEVNLNEYAEVTLDKYFEYVSTRISTSYANNHVRKQVDFYGAKVDYIKKQECDDWSFLEKYIDISRIPKIYQQFYDVSEFEYMRKEVEELYQEDMFFFGYYPNGADL